MNRELETDGVPAPSDFELQQMYDAKVWRIEDLTAERDGYRAVAEQRAAEVERLREENGQIADLCDGTLSTNAELAAKVERLTAELAICRTLVELRGNVIEELMDERDTLAAKVERLRGALLAYQSYVDTNLRIEYCKPELQTAWTIGKTVLRQTALAHHEVEE